MPKVGKMKFPYTKKGMEEAQTYSGQTGKQVEIEEYRGGGLIPKYQRGGLIPGLRQRLGGMRPRLGGARRGLGRGMAPRQGGRPGLGGGRNLGGLANRLRSMYKKGGKVK